MTPGRRPAAASRAARTAHGDPPEAYWVGRGSRVIGDGPLGDLPACRQVETYRVIHDLISSRRPPPPVVDLGCNVGVLGQLLRQWGHGGDYLGIDRNPHALVRARARFREQGMPGHERLLLANLRALPLASASQRVVVMKDVLEHLEDFRPALGEALRVTRERLLVANYLPWQEAPSRRRRDPRGFYENVYDRGEVLEFLTQRGWVVQETRTTRERDGRPNEVVVLGRA